MDKNEEIQFMGAELKAADRQEKLKILYKLYRGYGTKERERTEGNEKNDMRPERMEKIGRCILNFRKRKKNLNQRFIWGLYTHVKVCKTLFLFIHLTFSHLT